jgi:hypothetical protein
MASPAAFKLRCDKLSWGLAAVAATCCREARRARAQACFRTDSDRRGDYVKIAKIEPQG